LNYAKKQGVVVSDKYKDFKIKKENLEVIVLSNEEFESLFYLDLSANKRLAQVRDVFCFACTTGLRYSDLAQLKREHIKSDEIRITVKKTKEQLSVPLNPYSKAILAKYKAMHRPLPVISNQKLNDYIKELCKIAGISELVEIVRFRGTKREAITYKKYELIGVHTGRKTFATLSLEKGMSAEEVMTITGHRDYQSFKRYVKITEQRKKLVMLKAWGGKLSSMQLKAV
jgi:integrase